MKYLSARLRAFLSFKSQRNLADDLFERVFAFKEAFSFHGASPNFFLASRPSDMGLARQLSSPFTMITPTINVCLHRPFHIKNVRIKNE
jgi:hypothetical protein